MARHLEIVDVAERRIDDDAAPVVAVVGRHAGVRPHHLVVLGVDDRVVAGVHVLAHLYCANLLRRHLREHVHDVAHLHLDDEGQAATVSGLQIRAVEHEEVRKVGNHGAQVGLGIVVLPDLA